MTLNPDDVSEAWCHQWGYVGLIEEIGWAVRFVPGDTFVVATLWVGSTTSTRWRPSTIAIGAPAASPWSARTGSERYEPETLAPSTTGRCRHKIHETRNDRGRALAAPFGTNPSPSFEVKP